MEPKHVVVHRPQQARHGRLIVVKKNLCATKGVTWPKDAGFQPTCKNCRRKVA